MLLLIHLPLFDICTPPILKHTSRSNFALLLVSNVVNKLKNLALVTSEGEPVSHRTDSQRHENDCKQSSKDCDIAPTGSLRVRVSVSDSCHRDDDQPHRVLEQIQIGIGPDRALEDNHGVGHGDDRHHKEKQKRQQRIPEHCFQDEVIGKVNIVHQTNEASLLILEPRHLSNDTRCIVVKPQQHEHRHKRIATVCTVGVQAPNMHNVVDKGQWMHQDNARLRNEWPQKS
mmetsp:Transcript_3696/g.8446  ORF Transcript_3696/g.8446 Transcript_3696/m.8446 type:complete len:229 (-) Transcript_3696:369-1055(-)